MTRQEPPNKQKYENGFASSPAVIGALIAFVFALLWMIFGFWKLLVILFLTIVGAYIGFRYFRDHESIKKLIDKILPPGMFR
ncbi:MAG TPA: DUF2273 domain-containing protein [Clostridia bacterium]|nr:DUF2273 domain-containing protein [Clostridia bacterium]